jgi:hypothetical protein
VQLATLVLILMSWSGCATRIISADQMEIPVAANKAFTAPMDGWFMTETRYQRYRRAVADKIMELQIQKGEEQRR